MTFAPIDEERWNQGLGTERHHPWSSQDLAPKPVDGVDGIGGSVAIISMHSPDGGMTYEQCEPVGDKWHRHTASAPIPDIVRPA